MPTVITPIVPSVPAMMRPVVVVGVTSPYPMELAVMTAQYTPSEKVSSC